MRPNTSININASDASKDETGLTIPATQIGFASVQIVMTGTASGTMDVQFSNDIPQDCSTDSSGNLQPTNWSKIGSPTTVTLTGTAGVFFIPIFQCSFNFIRCLYTHNNGSAGTVTARLTTQAY